MKFKVEDVVSHTEWHDHFCLLPTCCEVGGGFPVKKVQTVWWEVVERKWQINLHKGYWRYRVKPESEINK